jgi:hypothetical protein
MFKDIIEKNFLHIHMCVMRWGLPNETPFHLDRRKIVIPFRINKEQIFYQL